MVLIGLPVIVVVALVVLLLLGLAYSLGEMMRLAMGKQPLWKRTLLWPLRVVSSRIDKMVEKIVARASHQFVLASPAVARMLQRTAVQVENLSGEVLQNAVETYETFRFVRNQMVPSLIAQAVTPLRNIVTRHTERLDDLEELNRRVAVEIGDGLRSLPWGVGGGLVANFNQWFDSYRHLWTQVFGPIQTRVTELYQVTVPQLQRDVNILRDRLDSLDIPSLDAVRNRIADLERWRESVAMPRLDALADAVDFLSDQVFGPVEGGLTALLERVTEIERQLREDIADRFTELELGLAELRLDLEEGIRTGLEVFRSRIEALETEVFQVIPATLAAMQLAIDTLAQEVFDEVGAGLTTLTARIIAIEQEIQNRILPGFDAILGRIDALEAQIRDDILPRIRALEDILAPAAFAALVMATLRTSAPYLFCRNVVTSATEACAAPEDRIDDLLAAAFLLIGSISIIELARELQAITGVSAAAIDEWVIED